MNIQRMEVPGLAQYSYVVYSGGEAVVIDPIRDIDRYIEFARRRGLRITQILETHIHADFASGAAALAERTGAQLALSGHVAGEQYRSLMPHHQLFDGDSVHAGGMRLQALHTPGHTPEHLSFVLYDMERAADYPVALFSGDFLFVGSMGRPDLLGEEAKQGLAHELFRSAHDRLRHLPDSLQLYPGHGAGSLCGSGMSERTESTLGYERAVNPLFRLDESTFVAEILSSVPPMPDYYPRMKRLNSTGAEDISAEHGRRALSVEEVAGLANREDVLLLDTRRPEAFGGAHIPGAINIGSGQNLSLWAGWLLDPDSRIVLIAESGDDEAARLSLVRVGLDKIEGYLANGFGAWVESGKDLARTPQLSTSEVHDGADERLVLDVRSDGEWKKGHIQGARHLMLGVLGRDLETIPRDRDIVTVCGSGYRSSIAASLLAQHGFDHVSSMDGGMGAWNQRGLPVVLTERTTEQHSLIYS